MIAIIDYATGNLRSVINAMQRIGAESIVTYDAKIISKADRVILPGVGDASVAMSQLKERGLDSLISTLNQPVIGICVGMQIMCKYSEEGNAKCLGIFDTNVTKFKREDSKQLARLKIPHMGWNSIEFSDNQLFENINQGDYVYYIHSYAPEICQHTIARTEYGRVFSGALANKNFYGTQFHPEKSGEIGEQILKNFLTL